jgi:hypothetical protein
VSDDEHVHVTTILDLDPTEAYAQKRTESESRGIREVSEE